MAGKPFSNDLSLRTTLKMGSRSLKSNQFFYMSQQYRCVSLAKIHPFVRETVCRHEATPTRTLPPTESALKTICHPPYGGGHKYIRMLSVAFVLVNSPNYLPCYCCLLVFVDCYLEPYSCEPDGSQ